MELNWPPDEWPKSGENWFCSTVSSATASLGSETTGPVTLSLLLSIPSMVKLLLRGRCPPTDGPVPAPVAPLVETPAFSSDKLSTPLPLEVLGRSINCLCSNAVCTWDVVVSMTAAAAVTSTVAVLVPTSSFRLAVATLFNWTSTLFSWALLNPEAVTVIV